jgi:hypothetical protein
MLLDTFRNGGIITGDEGGYFDAAPAIRENSRSRD